ncbi:YaaC-like Protein [Parageobacillus thermantarcticus]|uniref:YaaC-like Protein n=1 Tax=Parageobacillus thermantarcticus TaxID=186116 RepID=A0A1I0TUR3_9BACL|nr:YaaC family protein [Parageobacillus thermantarcticus]SFA54666.1 YaaC-like Protein [Parageobacillus thermantarcticus]
MFDCGNISNKFIVFHSADIAQQLLRQCYVKQKRKDAVQKSYANCYPFLYYLEHGQNFYSTARHAPLSIKPVLLFYGMVQLLKACLLTVDADYPESTSVLAHGVSTRKRKKQGYEFFDDEVKVQKNGLFTHFSEKMFHVKQSAGEKFRMITLLQRICELHQSFAIFNNEKILSIEIIHNSSRNTIAIPIEILDHYHMSLNRFIHYIEHEWRFSKATFVKEEDHFIHIEIQSPLQPIGCEPLMFHLNGTYRIPTKREKIFMLPEVIAHYLLLYNLSMISRYETEWWSELLHAYSSNAYTLIVQFLSLTAEKVPLLLYEYLTKQLFPSTVHS